MKTATLDRPDAPDLAAAAPAPEPQPFVYGGPSDPMPPEADPDALAELAQGRGRLALTELVAAIGVLDSALKARLKLVKDGDHPSKHINVIDDVRSRRRVYASRAAALAAILKVKVTIPPEPKVPIAFELVARFPEGATLKASVDKVTQQARQQLATIEAELESTIDVLNDPERYQAAGAGKSRKWAEERELDSFAWGVRQKLTRLEGRSLAGLQKPERHEIANDVTRMVNRVGQIAYYELTPERWSQDGFLLKVGALMARQREHRATIASLTNDLASGQSLVANRVMAAVDQAGGEQQVLADLREALISSGKWLDADPEFPKVTKAKARMTEIMSRLDGCAPGSTTHKSLKSEHAELVSSLEALEPAIEIRRLEQIRALLASAIAGLEDAREAIDLEVRKAPKGTFQDGFADALADARFDRSVIHELANR